MTEKDPQNRIIGYARVSTYGQTLDAQPEQLRPARRSSVRIAPWQRQYLGGCDRQRIMEAARRWEKATYQRGDGRHGGDLRPSGIAVLWSVLFRGLSRHGFCDPALSQIADEARLAVSTVQAAIGHLEVVGILTRVRRGLVVTMGTVRRWAQWTNAYLFRPPEAWASDTGSRSALVSVVKKKALERAETTPIGTLPAADQMALVLKWGLAGPPGPANGGNPA